MFERSYLHGPKQVYGHVQDDQLSPVAAGAAFFIFLSIFPALASVNIDLRGTGYWEYSTSLSRETFCETNSFARSFW